MKTEIVINEGDGNEIFTVNTKFYKTAVPGIVITKRYPQGNGQKYSVVHKQSGYSLCNFFYIPTIKYGKELVKRHLGNFDLDFTCDKEHMVKNHTTIRPVLDMMLSDSVDGV